MLETSSASAANTTNHGIQLPGLVEYTQTSIQLSLTMDSNFVVNEHYYTIISTINENGVLEYNLTVEFGMFNNTNIMVCFNFASIIAEIQLFCVQIHMTFSQCVVQH